MKIKVGSKEVELKEPVVLDTKGRLRPGIYQLKEPIKYIGNSILVSKNCNAFFVANLNDVLANDKPSSQCRAKL